MADQKIVSQSLDLVILFLRLLGSLGFRCFSGVKKLLITKKIFAGHWADPQVAAHLRTFDI